MQLSVSSSNCSAFSLLSLFTPLSKPSDVSGSLQVLCDIEKFDVELWDYQHRVRVVQFLVQTTTFQSLKHELQLMLNQLFT